MIRNILIAGIVSLSIASVSSHDFDIGQFKSQIPDGIVPEGYNMSSLPSPEDAKKLFEEKCYRATKSDEVFLKAENASVVFRECLTGLVDFDDLQQKIDEARAQPNGDLDLVFNNNDIGKFKSQKPDDILTDGFNIPSLPTPHDVIRLFQQKCYKATNSDNTVLKVENASEVLRECLTGLVDFETLHQEIDAARAQLNGDLHLVFNKYCRKRAIAIECFKDFMVAIEPCLNENEVTRKAIFVKIITKLVKFVCDKDGNHIALFVAEKGPECFDSKKEALMQCVNSTMSGYVPTKTLTLDNLPPLIFGEKQCNDIKSLEQCIVKELKLCEEYTSANLVASLFRFVRSETPCANVYTTASPNAAIIS